MRLFKLLVGSMLLGSTRAAINRIDPTNGITYDVSQAGHSCSGTSTVYKYEEIEADRPSVAECSQLCVDEAYCTSFGYAVGGKYCALFVNANADTASPPRATFQDPYRQFHCDKMSGAIHWDDNSGWQVTVELVLAPVNDTHILCEFGFDSSKKRCNVASCGPGTEFDGAGCSACTGNTYSPAGDPCVANTDQTRAVNEARTGTVLCPAGLVSDTTTVGGAVAQAGGQVTGGPSDVLGVCTDASADGKTIVMSSNVGSRVYDKYGSSWVQRGDMLPGKASSISHDGNTVVVGISQDSRVSVYDFVPSLGEWEQRGGDLVGTSGDKFGRNVDLTPDGQSLAVVASQSHAVTYNGGAVFVYDRNGDGWTQRGSVIGGDEDDIMRVAALSGDGNTLAVGAQYNDANGNQDAGKVRIFAWDGSQWSLEHTLTGSSAGHNLGSAVAVNYAGTVVAVGASGEDRVRVYSRVSGALTSLGADIDGASGSLFGTSVALSSDGYMLTVGAPDDGSATGSAHVYAWTGTAWTQIGAVGSEVGSYGQAGYSVAMAGDGTRLVVGAIGASGFDGQVIAYDVTRPRGPDICAPCPNNKYRAADMSACAYNTDLGSVVRIDKIAITPCPLGQDSAPTGGLECEPCPANQYRDASMDVCAENTHGGKIINADGSGLIACPAGQGSRPDTNTCGPCIAGQYFDATLEACTACPCGTTTIVEGASDASACVTGADIVQTYKDGLSQEDIVALYNEKGFPECQ